MVARKSIFYNRLPQQRFVSPHYRALGGSALLNMEIREK